MTASLFSAAASSNDTAIGIIAGVAIVIIAALFVAWGQWIGRERND